MSNESAIKIMSKNVTLNPSPIAHDWILVGNPVARNRMLSRSLDGTARTYMWDCTSGRFNWFYDADETAYIIEGSVQIKETSGVSRRVSAGESIFFPAGSRAEWTVDDYIRKIAFLRSPLPRSLRIAEKVYKFLKRLAVRGRGNNPVLADIQGS